MADKDNRTPQVIDYENPSTVEKRVPVLRQYDVAGLAAFIVILIPGMIAGFTGERGSGKYLVLAILLAAFARRKFRKWAGAPAELDRQASEVAFRWAVRLAVVVLIFLTGVSARCRHGWSWGYCDVGITYSTSASPCNLPYYGLKYWPITDRWVVWSAW